MNKSDNSNPSENQEQNISSPDIDSNVVHNPYASGYQFPKKAVQYSDIIQLNEDMHTLAHFPGNVEIPVLFDTGANLSLIPLKTLKYIDPALANQIKELKRERIIRGVSSHCVQIIGSVGLHFALGSNHYFYNFYVVEDSVDSTILGRDFMKQFRVNIDCNNLTATADCCFNIDNDHYRQSSLPITPTKHDTFTEHAIEKHRILFSLYPHSTLNAANNSLRKMCINHTHIAEDYSKQRDLYFDVNLAQARMPNYRRLLYYAQKPKHNSPICLSPPEHMVINDDILFDRPQRLQLNAILHENVDAFLNKEGQLGLCNLETLTIKLKPEAEPVYTKPYRISPFLQTEMDKQVQRYQRNDVITPCDSPWSSPVLMVPKGVKRTHAHIAKPLTEVKYRMVVDLRRVNKQIVHDTRIIPHIDDILDQIGKAYSDGRKPRVLSVFDISDAYYQIPLDFESQLVTAFQAGDSQYCFKRMPQGLSTSAGVLCKVMKKILQPYIGKFILNYMDDILIFSNDSETHLEHIKLTLEAFKKANLKLHPKKCKFAVKEADFLGFKFSSDGIMPSENHVQALKTYSPPTTVKETRRFLGLCNYFRRHIPNRSELMNPLTSLTRKNAPFKWSETCQTSFETLISLLTSRPLLAYPNFHQKFYLATDASTSGFGACLMQWEDDTQSFQPIAYYSRALNDHEKNYAATKLELVSAVNAIQHFKVYLQNPDLPFTLFTDCSALSSIIKKPQTNPQMARFALILQNYNFDIKHVKGLTNSTADFLSRKTMNFVPDRASNYVDQYPDNQTPFPVAQLSSLNLCESQNKNDELMQQTLSSNSFATRKKDPNKQALVQLNQRLTQRDSLIGEIDMSDAMAFLFVDEAAVNAKNILHDKVQDKIDQNPVEQHDRPYNLRPRNRSVTPDNERSSDIDKKQPQLTSDKDTINLTPPDTVYGTITLDDIRKAQQGDLFCKNMISFLTTGNIYDKEMVCDINKLSELYVVFNEILYRLQKPVTPQPIMNTLIFVPNSLVYKIIEFQHCHVNNNHYGVLKTLFLLRQTFYWPNMERSVSKFVGSCEICLTSKRNQHTLNPPMTLFEMTSQPFDRLVIDLVGPLPLTARRNLYIGVVVDSYSRYIIAFPLKNKSANEFAVQFYEKVLCIYGAPRHIHSDRGSEFANETFRSICDLYHIDQTFNSAYHPTSSGLAEAAVKRVTSLLRTMTQTSFKIWDIQLPQAVFTINTTPSASTKHSPYLLLFGRVPTYPLAFMAKIEDDTLQSRNEILLRIIDNHSTLQEIIQTTQEEYAQKAKHYFDQNKKEISLQKGSIVFVKEPLSQSDNKKLSPIFQGPYIVIDILPFYRAVLRHLHTHQDYPHPLHFSRLKLAEHYDKSIAYRV